MEKERIAKVVDEANFSEVHRQTGISLSGVSRILRGHRAASSRKLSIIALCLGLTMDELHNHLVELQVKVARSRTRKSRRHTAA